MRWLRDDRGATMAIVAVALTGLLLCAGLALDFGRAHLLQAQLQTAVDAGALAGALQVAPMVETAAREALLLNATWPGGSHGARLEGVDITVNRESHSVTVTATLRLPTHFLRLVGIQEMRLTRSGSAAPVRRRGSRLID